MEIVLVTLADKAAAPQIKQSKFFIANEIWFLFVLNS
jgi:hypothetical protein